MVGQVTLDHSHSKQTLSVVHYKWIQFVVYAIIAAAVFGSLFIAGYCALKGREISWQYKFGIMVQVTCKK